MKVLYIAHFFFSKTAARVTTEEIIKMLLQKRHTVTLIAPSTYLTDDSFAQRCRGLRTRSAFTGVPNRVARKSKFISVLIATLGYINMFVTGLRTIKREGRFDAVIGQYHAFHLAPVMSYFLSRVTKIPLVVKIHDIVPGSPTKKKIELIYEMLLLKINKLALRRASRILSPSTEITELLIKHLNVDSARIVVFPNTVDIPSFPSQRVKSLRTQLGLEEKKIVLFMGSAFEDRGLEVVLKALHMIKDPSIMLVVIGTRDKRYMKFAKQLHSNDRVIFKGRVPHGSIPLYIYMADVCVGPVTSRPYTYGMVPRKVIEYMACGKPVITARGAVTKDLAIKGISAVLVESDNEVELASAILSLVNDTSGSTNLGREAKRIIAERYCTRKLADKLNGVLREVLQSAMQ